MKLGSRRLWSVAAAAVMLDQAAKTLLTGTELVLIPNVLQITTVRNDGFALGLFPHSALPALLLSLMVIAALLFFLARNRLKGLSEISVGMILGGAFGNLIDRIVLSYVRDSFELLFIHFYVFNLADVFVTVGAALTAIHLLFFERNSEKK